VGVPGGAYIGCDAGPALGPGETVAVETCYSCGDLPFTPNCGDPGGGGNVAWFETVGDGTTYTAAVCATGFTPGMRVYRGNCATMHCVADAPADACGAGVTWCTHPGIEYHIVMYGNGPVTCGAVEVSLASDGTPCP
ncbi:MAG: hypothetical protein HKN62_11160, partial [Phycisphaerales bacterium]|nr:hypothetical protein [Phycisphaerales bacterium]